MVEPKIKDKDSKSQKRNQLNIKQRADNSNDNQAKSVANSNKAYSRTYLDSTQFFKKEKQGAPSNFSSRQNQLTQKFYQQRHHLP